ncbi:MAG: hypothetical protein LQ343_006016 [Gyalolechia ehrenbergii]|nr:MAG: hypothetical protein LQ343_006016 [Gyalolechia ehrenbergii]
MTLLRRFDLLFLLLLQALLINALPPIKPDPQSSRPKPITAITKPGFLDKILNAFPPGPPEAHYFYIVPDTDIAIEFSPFGFIPGRNETLVQDVFYETLHDSLNWRIAARMPEQGYKLQVRDFLISVMPTVGVRELTWGLWTMVLAAMGGYVRAYSGYDFMFEVRLLREQEVEGLAIGTGFAMTRG